MKNAFFSIPAFALALWLSQVCVSIAQEKTPADEPVPAEIVAATLEAPASGAIPPSQEKEVKHAEKATRIKPDAGKSLASDISKSCKERERRLTAMNDAMLKLREAGDDEAADRLEARLQAMIETKDPREDDALVANKAELLLMKRSVLDLAAEVANLRSVLEQNNRIIDEILKKAVPDISASVIEEMKNQAKKQEIRKVP